MKVSLEFEVEGVILQSIGRQLGKLVPDLTEMDVQGYLGEKLSDHLRDIATRERAMTMGREELFRRVYWSCVNVRHNGPIPIYGATDRELMDLIPGVATPKMRWARYWLSSRGYLEESGKRGTGKVWKGKPQTKPLPVWLEEVPEVLLEDSHDNDESITRLPPVLEGQDDQERQEEEKPAPVT